MLNNTIRNLKASELCIIQDRIEEIKENLNILDDDITVIINDDNFEIKLSYKY